MSRDTPLRRSSALPVSELTEVLGRPLIFVSGKGGVGKTAVSQAIALRLSRQGKKTLWVAFEDPLRPAGELRQVGPNLSHLNCDPTQSFEEYAAMKIGGGRLTRVFIENKLTKYLAQAAPGIHELVLLGKVWHERGNYDHVVVDMPSTGYGLAMFQSTENIARLFRGGPINRDAEAMLDTFRNPKESGYVIVSLPEEMPLRESLELDEFLLQLFPDNPSAFIANRCFPEVTGATNVIDSDSPLAKSVEDYCVRRSALESANLGLWREFRLRWSELPFVPPPVHDALEAITGRLAEALPGREVRSP